MITGSHVIVYAEDAAAARAFFRDVLGFPHVDAGDGWLIFKLPPAELAAHPTEGPPQRRHELYLMCDDIDATVRELTALGVEFTSSVADQGWGRITTLRVPGGGEVGLYEPRHPTAYDLEGGSTA
jgi:catechol 2,3-dioxygenase-like lactoylglutathione lyase family enzyme